MIESHPADCTFSCETPADSRTSCLAEPIDCSTRPSACAKCESHAHCFSDYVPRCSITVPTLCFEAACLPYRLCGAKPRAPLPPSSPPQPPLPPLPPAPPPQPPSPPLFACSECSQHGFKSDLCRCGACSSSAPCDASCANSSKVSQSCIAEPIECSAAPVECHVCHDYLDCLEYVDWFGPIPSDTCSSMPARCTGSCLAFRRCPAAPPSSPPPLPQPPQSPPAPILTPIFACPADGCGEEAVQCSCISTAAYGALHPICYLVPGCYMVQALTVPMLLKPCGTDEIDCCAEYEHDSRAYFHGAFCYSQGGCWESPSRASLTAAWPEGATPVRVGNLCNAAGETDEALQVWRALALILLAISTVLLAACAIALGLRCRRRRQTLSWSRTRASFLAGRMHVDDVTVPCEDDMSEAPVQTGETVNAGGPVAAVGVAGATRESL